VEVSFLREAEVKIVRVHKGVVLGTVVIGWLLSGSMQAVGELYAVDKGAIGQAEEVLKRAAKESPQRNTQADFVERDIHDITFLLDQSWKAAEKSDDAARKDYAHQALALLQRSVTRGSFERTQVEPVFTLIRQLLSDQIG
jgi:hypothetical protein